MAQAPTRSLADIQAEIEATLRSALSMVAYGQCWGLWEGATQQSRISISREQACKICDKATSRLSTGGIEDFMVTATSHSTAVVSARIRVESPKSGAPQSISRSFTFFFEDGRWRYHLWDYLSLVSY